MKTNEENDRCIECSAEVIDGGSWGYCIPCSNRVFAELKENAMKTNEQIQDKAYAIAYGCFYCEDGEAWEPFEHYSEDQLAEEVEMMTDIIARAMRWAQE
jgi:hypothetical protein